MITVARAVLIEFRTVLRQACQVAPRGSGPWVRLCASPHGLRLRAATEKVALERFVSGEFSQEEIVIPFAALKDIATGPDGITFESQAKRTVMSWTEQGIPWRQPLELPDKTLLPFPDGSPALAVAPAGFWDALRDAVATADQESMRYALNHLQLDAAARRIVATDGRHLLEQRGFKFPWEGAILVPASRVFQAASLRGARDVEIGVQGDWCMIRTGPWTVQLAIDRDGRFPDTDRSLPAAKFAVSTLDIARSDAEFLLRSISALPTFPDDPHATVTFDLGPEVQLRAGPHDSQVALTLTNSTCDGEPQSVGMNRRYLLRALKFGFRQLRFHSGGCAPICCDDGERRYTWASLGGGQPVSDASPVTQITSPPASAPVPQTRGSRPRRRAA